jgi:hypothetical protein
MSYGWTGRNAGYICGHNLYTSYNISAIAVIESKQIAIYDIELCACYSHHDSRDSHKQKKQAPDDKQYTSSRHGTPFIIVHHSLVEQPVPQPRESL